MGFRPQGETCTCPSCSQWVDDNDDDDDDDDDDDNDDGDGPGEGRYLCDVELS